MDIQEAQPIARSIYHTTYNYRKHKYKQQYSIYKSNFQATVYIII